MKGFFFLFSFYLLSLMVMPCPDGRELSRQVQPTITAALQGHNHNHAETCPPFCSCSCCNAMATVVPASPFIYENPPLPSKRLVCFYTNKQLSNFKEHIWQPPRLS